MRRSVYCVFLSVVLGIAACSSDDVDGGPEGKDDKVSRVTSIVCGDASMSFTYDDDGRLMRCVDMGGTDTMLYRYDMENGRIYTNYKWCHEGEGDYPYQEYTDTLFLKNGIVDSCAGWFAYGLSPDMLTDGSHAYTIKFAYDGDGHIIRETVCDLFRWGTALENSKEFVWTDGNIAEYVWQRNNRCSVYKFSYTPFPGQSAFGFTYDVIAYLRHHVPLVPYGYFGLLSRNLPEHLYFDDGNVCSYACTFDEEERLAGYSESWKEQRWDYEVKWETIER